MAVSFRRKPAASPPTYPSLPPRRAIELLQQQLEKGQTLLGNGPISSPAAAGWETVTRDILTKAFGSQSPHVDAVMGIGIYRNAFGGTEQELIYGRAKDMEERAVVIKDLIQLLQTEAGITCPSRDGDPFRLEQIISRTDLLKLVREDFEAGKYESAVFTAFRHLEEAVRNKIQQPPSAIGVTLMSTAFSPKGGLLKHPAAKVESESDALHSLMRGAIGWYKNPSSHRTVGYNDPQHAVQVLAFANILLDLLDASV